MNSAYFLSKLIICCLCFDNCSLNFGSFVCVFDNFVVLSIDKFRKLIKVSDFFFIFSNFSCSWLNIYDVPISLLILLVLFSFNLLDITSNSLLIYLLNFCNVVCQIILLYLLLILIPTFQYL